MKEFWQKFWLIIIGCFITVCLSALAGTYMAAKTAKSYKLDNAAPKEFVIEKVNDLRIHSDNKDDKLEILINTKASLEKVDMIYQVVMDNKEQNKKIYNMLYELNGRVK